MNVNSILLLAFRFPGQHLFGEDIELLTGDERWVTLEEEDGGNPIRVLKRVLGGTPGAMLQRRREQVLKC